MPTKDFICVTEAGAFFHKVELLVELRLADDLTNDACCIASRETPTSERKQHQALYRRKLRDSVRTHK